MTLNIKKAVLGILAMAGSLGATAAHPADIFTTPLPENVNATEKKTEKEAGALFFEGHYSSETQTMGNLERDTYYLKLSTIFDFMVNDNFFWGTGYHVHGGSTYDSEKKVIAAGNRSTSSTFTIPLEGGFKIGHKYLAFYPFVGINGNYLYENKVSIGGNETDYLPEKFADRLSMSGRSGVRLRLFRLLTVSYNYDFPLNTDVGFSKIGDGKGYFSFGICF